jgi:site-specific recombinase XerD
MAANTLQAYATDLKQFTEADPRVKSVEQVDLDVLGRYLRNSQA